MEKLADAINVIGAIWMLKQYEELAVLEQGDDGAIVSIRGQQGPSVILGSSYLGHLQHVLSKAEFELAEISGAFGTASLRLLCVEVKTLLATYDETCNKYAGEPSAAKSLAAITAELDDLRKQLASL